jgi:Mn2+/Fe2+ NRAMP family transporter
MILGRYSVATGKTSLQFLDEIPGPRVGARWIVWMYVLMTLFTFFQQGAMLGGVAMVLNLIAPGISIMAFALVTAGVTVGLLRLEGYGPLEKVSAAMMGVLVLTTLASVGLLQSTPYAHSASDLLDGLTFTIPLGGLTTALAVFGITGIGTSELVYYPYWCVEKGYADAAGPPDSSPVWLERARGWIRVMNVDALVSMVVYTVLTVAFYVLGASVLHARGDVPEGMEMISTLSKMYTEILGPGAFYLFLAGAFFALFSTLYVSIAANARVLADYSEIMAWSRPEHRRTVVRWLVTLTPALNLLLFVTFQAPLWMVIIGGLAQVIMLPVLAGAAVYLRYGKLDPRLAPGRVLDTLVWISAITIVAVGVYGLVLRVLGA